jgi:MoaA/NifB/PqqE/SkfB family radical SAM enzyme
MVSRLSLRALHRRIREARALARAFQFPHQPVVAQVVPIRRCNLACTYCNEFDHLSEPVPLAEMAHRIDRLSELGTGIMTLSGGEPLLHPDVESIIRRIRARGAIATVITNGYLLTPPLIDGLNGAGLDSLQISIDNVVPDEVSKKSLKVLDQARWLRNGAVRRDGQRRHRRRHSHRRMR